MLKRLFAGILSALLLSATLASCASQTPEPGPGTAAEGSEEATDAESEPETEPATEPVESASARTSPVLPEFGSEYKAPEDGSFTVCGVPLSEYTMILYFPGVESYDKLDRKSLLSRMEKPISSATGTDWKVSLVKNEKYDEAPKAEHEILFGTNFRRDGIPEYEGMSDYGVTADGTVYFRSPSPVLYGYLWELFLEEFLGVDPKSGERSGGCSVSECRREIPTLTEERIKAAGYSLVLDEPFDGDALNLDVWSYRGNGARRDGFNAPSQISVRDGNLFLTGEYRAEGEYGEGWYGAMVSLKQRYCRGYFEASIRTPVKTRDDFWAAFWVQGPNPYSPEASQGGVGPGGAEIDVMENFGPDRTTCTVWCSGYEGETGLCEHKVEVFDLNNNYAEDFHTYGLLWNESFYEFFVDGLLIEHTDYGYGTSTIPEEVILSLEIPEVVNMERTDTRVMAVDYLRIWQIP